MYNIYLKYVRVSMRACGAHVYMVYITQNDLESIRDELQTNDVERETFVVPHVPKVGLRFAAICRWEAN